jgi:Gylcosyl hydrolase family 115 C-terminal domain/Glycosyl hydrolase family 115
MGYDMSRFQTPDGTRSWLLDWATIQFGEEVAKDTADIMTMYGKLTARRKYEDLSITPFAFTTSDYDEAEMNFQAWLDMQDLAQKTHDMLPSSAQTAFFEMILHPVQAGRNVFEIYTKAALGLRYANEHRQSANDLAQEAKNAFTADQALTKQYHTMLSGKWNHMMDQTHIGYNNWQEPSSNSMPKLSSVSASSGRVLGVGIQGSSTTTDAARITVQSVNPYMPPAEQRWIDIFLREKGTLAYTISSNSSCVTVSSSNGTLQADGGPSQMRSVIDVDWTSAPAGNSAVELKIMVTNPANTPGTVVVVPLQNNAAPPDNFEGHIESNGVVSMEASHYLGVQGAANTSEANYITIPDYGRTMAGVKVWPVTSPVQDTTTGPYLVYRFYAYSSATTAKATVYLSSSENSDSERPNKFALSIDGKDAIVVQPTPMSSDAGTEPTGWDDAVTRNAWIKDAALGAVAPGIHELKVWLLNPTMVLTKVVVDLGSVKKSELGPPESFRRCAWRKGRREAEGESANCKLN